MVRIGRVTVRVNVMDRFNGRTRARVGISDGGMSEMHFRFQTCWHSLYFIGVSCC